MPAFPRVKSKASKIAFKILGTPPNIKAKKSKAQKLIDEQIASQENTRVK